MKQAILNRGKYSKNNGANRVSLKFFLNSTEFAAYGEMVPTGICMFNDVAGDVVCIE